MKGKLTPRKEKFCQLVASGIKYYDAYLSAGYKQNQTPNALRSNAFKLYHEPVIYNRIVELQKENELELRKQYTYDKHELCLELGKIIKSPTIKQRDQIYAIQVLAKLMGFDVNLNANINMNIKQPNDMSMEELKEHLNTLKNKDVI